MNYKQQITKACQDLVQRAERMFRVDLGDVEVHFDIRGSNTARAVFRDGVYSLHFNPALLTAEHIEHIIKETVPHEVAHLVCFAEPLYGDNHDRGWKRTCILLGGNGKRVGNTERLFARGYTYEYLTKSGRPLRVSEKHHRHNQNGGELFVGQDVVPAISDYKIVAYRGIKFNNPIAIEN